jgi:hypothetical protein
MAKLMDTKQKCNKLANVLETFAAKLRDPQIGEELWESEEPTMQILVTQLQKALNKAAEVTKSSSKKRVRVKKKVVEEDEWPDLIDY